MLPPLKQAWPDPWPNTPDGVRLWRLTDPYDRYFKNRADIVEALFNRDAHSIDATALATVALGSLATYRFADVPLSTAADQRRFRMLMEQHCPTFVNRVSISEMLQHARTEKHLASFEEVILRRFPLERLRVARQVSEDPLARDFNHWADKQTPRIPKDLRFYDYAACIFRLYRNSVIHELRPARGKDVQYLGPDDPVQHPIFYANRGAIAGPQGDDDPVVYTRFGIYPPYLLTLLQEALTSLRAWAIANDRDIFEHVPQAYRKKKLKGQSVR